MTDLFFHHDAKSLPKPGQNRIPVLMYGRRPPGHGTACVGGPVLGSVQRLGIPANTTAFDLLTVALAVTAADTFVSKYESDDGWTRDLRLNIPLSDPECWASVVPLLENALHFLSGDQWHIEVTGSGREIPFPQKRGRLTNIAQHDSVSLFSGGLDSAIGVLDLIAQHRRPVLISHSYRGDAERQNFVWRKLPVQLARFSAVANPVSLLDRNNDVQMRTRSFNFLAFGALVAATMAERCIAPTPVDLFVPENGLIALNPPLTSRRIGALSTRTTHPYFLTMMQLVLDELNLPVRIVNPYAVQTKGEMLQHCQDPVTLNAIAEHTVSCGKWKRTNMQCGKCVPCLIRRASFHAAGFVDHTPYNPAGQNLAAVLGTDGARDDLMAMILAARRMPGTSTSRWVATSGPLPTDRAQRDALLRVADRGIAEVSAYLNHLNLLV